MKVLNIFLIIFFSACISEQKPPSAVSNPKPPPVVKKDPVKEKPVEKKEPTVDEDLAFLMLKTEVPDSGKSSFSEVRQFLLPEKKKVYQLIFSEDSSHLVLVTNFYIKKISLGSLEEVGTLYPRKLVDGGFTGVAFSPDLNRILAGSSWENTASVYDWAGKKEKSFSCRKESFFAEDLVFLGSSKYALVCHNFASGKKDLYLYDSENSKTESTSLMYLKKQSDSSLLNYDSKTVRSVSADMKTNFRLKTDSEIWSLHYNPEKNLVFAGNNFGAEVWKISSKPKRIIKLDFKESDYPKSDIKLDHEFKNIVSFANDGSSVLIGNEKSAFIKDWKGNLRQVLGGHKDYVTAVSLSGNGKYAATASRDRLIIWALNSSDGKKKVAQLSERKTRL